MAGPIDVQSLDADLVKRLYADARAERWQLPLDSFSRLLELSARRALSNETPDRRRLERYLASLHLEDLALACACAEGIETAWDHFVREYRPVLYRAATAIDPSGHAREEADGLYGELFGLDLREGTRRSHFWYFHGRSSLATWLRAVLSQRYIDRLRRDRRTVPLTVDDESQPMPAVEPSQNADARKHADVIGRAVMAEVHALAPRDRLRLRCYYAQNLTLAEIGRLLGEHEATVSRQLARTRRTIRTQVESRLRHREGMTDAEIAECFAAVLEDPGPLDIVEMLGADPEPEVPRFRGS